MQKTINYGGLVTCHSSFFIVKGVAFVVFINGNNI